MPTLVTESLKTKMQAGTTGMIKPPVTILDNHGRVDKQAVEIGKNEQVEWINETGHQVQIVFDGEEPFVHWTNPFIIPGKSNQTSGRLKESVQPGQRYKYTVIGSEGNTDPIIIIEP